MSRKRVGLLTVEHMKEMLAGKPLTNVPMIPGKRLDLTTQDIEKKRERHRKPEPAFNRTDEKHGMDYVEFYKSVPFDEDEDVLIKKNVKREEDRTSYSQSRMEELEASLLDEKLSLVATTTGIKPNNNNSKNAPFMVNFDENEEEVEEDSKEYEKSEGAAKININTERGDNKEGRDNAIDSCCGGGDGDEKKRICGEVVVGSSEKLMNGCNLELPPGMSEQEALAVYEKYSFQKHLEPKLSIQPYRQDIVDAIVQNSVCILEGETGCGKTTQVPQYILDYHYKTNQYCNIIVTQPRRIAATSICKRVCNERGWDIGTVCGYQIGLDKVASDDTRILYCTTGVLLQRLIVSKSLNQFTHIILDEVHERSQDMDFCLLVIKKLLAINSPDVKIILMSATIDTQPLFDYFCMKIGDSPVEPINFLIEGQMFEVQEFYLDDMQTFIKIYPDFKQNAEEPCLPENVMDEVVNLIVRLNAFEEEDKDENSDYTERGSVLVFLPGLEQIDEMSRKLEPHIVQQQLIIRPLHSSIPGEEQCKAFDLVSAGSRKVILSTNIAESSLTVTDVKYVIDFCLSKQIVCDPTTNYTSLQLNWSSRDNCKQRKGRAGRVNNGRVFRMVFYEFYMTQLEEYSTPEIVRCSLEHLVLKTKLLDLGNPVSLLARALTPPNLANIENTILSLKEVGALSVHTLDPHNGDLTFLGRVVGTLPLDVHLGKLILFGFVFGMLDECIVISCLHSVMSIFSQPYGRRIEAYKSKMSWAKGTHCDSLALFNAYGAWQHMKTVGFFQGKKDELLWCKKNFLEHRKLMEVFRLVEDIRKRVGVFKITTSPNHQQLDLKVPKNQLILKLVLCGAFYPNYFLETHCIEEKDAMKDMSGHNPLNSVVVSGFPSGGGVYYRKGVERLFSACTPGDQPPKVFFELMKCFIEFEREKDTPIPIAVYAALRMKQMRFKMDIPYDTSELENSEKIKSHQIKAKTDPSFAEPHQISLPPPSQTIIALEVTELVDCGHFWARYADNQLLKSFEQMHFDLQRYVSRRDPGLKLKAANIGVYCAVPYMDKGCLEYYRARIDKIYPDGFTIEVLFMDFGNTALVKVHEVLSLDTYFYSYPFMAVEFKLINIQPSLLKEISGQWTELARNRFKQLMDRSKVHMAHIYSIVDGIVRVCIKILAGRGLEVDIGQELFKEGLADPIEETYFSKQNHKDRIHQADSIETAIRNINRGPLIIGDYPVDPVSPAAKHQPNNPHHSLWRNERKTTSAGPSNYWGGFGDNDNYNDDVDDGFVRGEGFDMLKMGQGEVTLRALMEQKEKEMALDVRRKGQLRNVSLKGPTSPYEIAFNRLTSPMLFVPLKVDQDSVNSIALTENPANQVLRLMTASFVKLNPTMTNLIARNTSILPSLLGLGSIVPLLFAPIAELRVNENRTKYTGAICGLGYHPGHPTKNPINPDKDIELSFDFEFDFDTLKLINEIRLTIDLMIGSDLEWSLDVYKKLQKEAQNKLFNLACTQRKPCKPECFSNSFRWGQVPKEHLFQHESIEMGDLGPKSSLMTLYNAVELQTPEDLERQRLRKLNVGGSGYSERTNAVEDDIVLFEEDVIYEVGRGQNYDEGCGRRNGECRRVNDEKGLEIIDNGYRVKVRDENDFRSRRSGWLTSNTRPNAGLGYNRYNKYKENFNIRDPMINENHPLMNASNRIYTTNRTDSVHPLITANDLMTDNYNINNNSKICYDNFGNRLVGGPVECKGGREKVAYGNFKNMDLFEKKAHHDWLMKKACSARYKMEQLHCLICNIFLPNPAKLTAHLHTALHRDRLHS